MFINKWLVVNAADRARYKEGTGGLCLYFAEEPVDAGDLYRFVQAQPAQRPFAVLLSGEDFREEKRRDLYLEKMIGLFFQPSYYLVNYRPLLFLTKRTQGCTTFLEQLIKKSAGQGIHEILIMETTDNYGSGDANQKSSFLYFLNENIDYAPVVKYWLASYLDNRDPSEIHFMVPSENPQATEILNNIQQEEDNLKGSEEYKFATAFYEKQKLIDEYRHQLYLKKIGEKNTAFYLSIQKEERAKGLKWYYYEYEILPLWYKQLGHVIKVLMGKRSFKSLFRDNVKKYKD